MQSTPSRLKQSTGNNRRWIFALALITPLLFAACPKNGMPDNLPVNKSTPPIPGAVAFNGERAMEHVKKQMEIGPRPPGSPELAKMREYITSQLSSSGLHITTDVFRA